MSKSLIIIAPDERLVVRAEEVKNIDDEIKELVNNMFNAMYHADGIGLAAVQIGVLKRVIVMDIHLKAFEDANLDGYKSNGKFCMINPRINELSKEEVVLMEGCLSIPEQNYEVKRPKCLTVKYKNINDKEQTLRANGWLARCIQHELDHLDGILYIKHLSKLKHDIAKKKAQKIKRYYER